MEKIYEYFFQKMNFFISYVQNFSTRDKNRLDKKTNKDLNGIQQVVGMTINSTDKILIKIHE